MKNKILCGSAVLKEPTNIQTFLEEEKNIIQNSLIN